MRDTDMFLERALAEEGLVTPDELVEARRFALKHDLDFVDALVQSGRLSSHEIGVTRAAMCETSYVPIGDYQPCHANTKLVPIAVAQRHCVFPLFVLDGVLTLAMEDPLNLEATDQVRQITRCEIDPVLCDRDALRSLISRAYSLTSDTPGAHGAGPHPHGTVGTSDAFGGDLDGQAQLSSVGDAANDTRIEESRPIVTAVNQLLGDAIAERASDIHLNPDEDRVHVRYRIDGVLQLRQGPPLTMHAGIVQRLKVMAHLDLTQTRRPQDGRFRFALPADHPARTADNSLVDVRLSTVPTVCGENVVMRLLTQARSVPSFPELGVTPPLIAQLKELLHQPYGMLLVSGPTGSGKTTTLYAALSELNDPSRNLMTIEDPVEIRMPYVRQIQTHTEIGLTFASALRSILRQDPDVVLVGEIRDAETAMIALQAALTGHMVLSTVHTNDAAGAVARLRDFGLAPFVINSAVLGVIAQRLLRRVCGSCSKPLGEGGVDDNVRRRLELQSLEGFVQGSGCRHCSQTGYRGRIGIYELLTFGHEVREVVDSGGSTELVRAAAWRGGMVPMWRDALEKARLGMTSVQEVASIAAMSLFEEAAVSDLEARKAA